MKTSIKHHGLAPAATRLEPRILRTHRLITGQTPPKAIGSCTCGPCVRGDPCRQVQSHKPVVRARIHGDFPPAPEANQNPKARVAALAQAAVQAGVLKPATRTARLDALESILITAAQRLQDMGRAQATSTQEAA